MYIITTSSMLSTFHAAGELCKMYIKTTKPMPLCKDRVLVCNKAVHGYDADPPKY